MNILYFVNRFPKLSESFVINEIHELERRGHRIAVFSLREPEIDMQHEEVDSLEAKVEYLPDPGVTSALRAPGRWCLDRDVIGTAAHTASPVKHAGAAYIAGHCARFVASLDFEIDHVHGHFLNWPKLAACYVGARIDVPVTTTAHAYGLYSSSNRRLLRILSDKLDRVVTISEYNRRYLTDEIGTSSPVDVVHMGIDPSKFQPSGSVVSNRLLTVARFEEKKGIPGAVEAIGRLADVDGLEYHIVGSGPQETAIRDRIDEHELEDTVSLLGHVSDERLIRELDEAELFVLPSVVAADGDRDGIPVALMEAMAMETIPVSTTVSGIPELIDHRENGLLVDPGDTEELAEVIRGFLEGSYEIDRSASRRTVLEEFAVHDCTADLIDVFDRC